MYKLLTTPQNRLLTLGLQLGNPRISGLEKTMR